MNSHSRRLCSLSLFLLVAWTAPRLPAQGTAFTYQGSLQNNGSAATGLFDLTFTLFDTNTGGSVVAGPLTNSPTGITNGLFLVTLDFGSTPFNGNARWLEIGVRTNGGTAFNTLSPRQQLTPTPYAIYANTASSLTGGLAASELGGTYSNAVTLNNGANVFDGSFYGQFFGSSFIGGNFVGNFVGSGSSLSDVWHTGGNFGTLPFLNFVGTTDNQPLIFKVNNQEAMRFEPTAETPNVVGGYSGNFVQPGLPGVTIGGGGSPFNNQPNIVTNNGNYATIAGGYHNLVSGYGGAILGGSVHVVGGNFGVIGGGQFNTDQGGYAFIGSGVNHDITTNGYTSFVGAGYANVMDSPWSVIAGGYYNTNRGGVSFIGCGDFNFTTTNAWYSFIGGGYQNIMDGYLGTVGGGWGNAVGSYGATIGGGVFNNIGTNVNYAFIGGGNGNGVAPGSGYSAIGGGSANLIQTNAGFSVIGGGYNNLVLTNADHAFIGGGWQNAIQGAAWESVIGGGAYNSLLPEARWSVIGGGDVNTNGSSFSMVGGGGNNMVQINAPYSFIGGGGGNQIGINSGSSFIGGGYVNSIGTNADRATLSGGNANAIQDGSAGATIGGGIANVIGLNSEVSTIAGGNFNYVANNNWQAAIGGGLFNTNAGFAATIPGGYLNQASSAYAFAAGQRAKALHQGSFVWADSQDLDFSSTNTNQFNVRANGGVVFNTGGAGMALDGQPILAGVVPSGQLSGTYPNVVNFNNPGNSFTGNGSGLGSVNAATLGGLSSSGFWKTTGNAGTTAGPNFIGTTDGQPLLIRGSFVGIGRSTSISGADAFSVEAPATAGNYGGMYINATNATARPFYGYAQAGAYVAWTYVDGADTNKWKLNLGGDRLTVTTTGLVGIGTTVPDSTLTVAGTADKPGGGAWAVFSDARLKKNVEPLTGALDRLLELRGVTYEYKDPQSIHELPGIQIGMIAQEVERVFPDWVDTAPNGMKRLSIHGFEALTVEALRTLRAEKDARIAELEKANARMRQDLAAQKETTARLESRLAALEKAFAGVMGNSTHVYAVNGNTAKEH